MSSTSVNSSVSSTRNSNTRITRRGFLRGVALAGTGALLAACAAPPPAAPGSAPAATSAPAAAAPAAGALNVSYMASGTYDEAAKAISADFEKATGAKVQVAAFPWATLRQNNTNDLVGGSGQYDVMSGGYYLADVYSYFEPLTPLIKKDNFGASIIPGLMDIGRSEWFDGNQIGVPYGIDVYGLLVRTDLFKAAGVDTKMSTWVDFLKAADALKKSGKLGDGVAPFVFAYGAVEQLPAIFFAAYGGSYINKDGKYALEADKATTAIQVVKDTVQYAPANALSLSIDDANAVFLDGKAAMLIGWPSFVRKNADDPVKSKVVGNWATTEFPLNDGAFPWLSMWQLFIPKASKHKDAAWTWIKEYTSEQNAKTFFEKWGIGSIYASVYEDKDLLAKHSHDFPSTLKNMSKAKNPPLSGESQDFMASTIGEVLQGKTDPAAAVKAINDKWATVAVPPALLQAAKGAGLMAK